MVSFYWMTGPPHRCFLPSPPVLQGAKSDTYSQPQCPKALPYAIKNWGNLPISLIGNFILPKTSGSSLSSLFLSHHTSNSLGNATRQPSQSSRNPTFVTTTGATAWSSPEHLTPGLLQRPFKRYPCFSPHHHPHSVHSPHTAHSLHIHIHTRTYTRSLLKCRSPPNGTILLRVKAKVVTTPAKPM